MNNREPTPLPTVVLPGTVNTNTYVSIGLVVVVLGGFFAVLNSVYSVKGEIAARLDKVEWRMGTYEKISTKETWNDVDMFKWAVRLQRENADPKKLSAEGLKVPEPEHIKDQSQ